MTSRPMGWEASRVRRREALSGYLFIAPVYSLMAVFVFYGIYFVARISLYKWDGVDFGSMSFRGASNYAKLFTDPVFYGALEHVIVFMVATVGAQMILGFLVALMLRQEPAGRAFFKALFYVPAALSTTIIARIFVGIFEPNFGLLNTALGLDAARNWLGDPSTALGAVIAANIFQWMGAQMIFYIAGLSGIPEEVFEAAQIDGAGFWRSAFRIAWPLLAPTHTTVIVLGIIGSIKTFDIVWLMTQGGPGNSTQFPATLLYKSVVSQFKAGYGAAISVVMVAICVGLSALQLRLYDSRKEA
jgi:raffinose/stachyose/melibiose transport system permease protein